MQILFKYTNQPKVADPTYLAVPKRHCTSNKQVREFFSQQTFYQGPIMIMYQFCRSRLCHHTQKARRLKKLLLVKARSRSCRGRRRHRTGFFSPEKFSFFRLAHENKKVTRLEKKIASTTLFTDVAFSLADVVKLDSLPLLPLYKKLATIPNLISCL